MKDDDPIDISDDTGDGVLCSSQCTFSHGDAKFWPILVRFVAVVSQN